MVGSAFVALGKAWECVSTRHLCCQCPYALASLKQRLHNGPTAFDLVSIMFFSTQRSASCPTLSVRVLLLRGFSGILVGLSWLTE